MSTELNCYYFTNNLCRSCSQLTLLENLRVEDKLLSFRKLTTPLLTSTTEILTLRQPSTVFPSRSKAKLSVSGTLLNPIIGLLDKKFKGIELLNCPLHLPCINQLLQSLPQIIKDYQLKPYDILSRTGELKGIIVNSNRTASEMMLRFILRSKEAIPRIRKAVLEIQTAHPTLKVVSANIQSIPNQVPEGPEEHLLSEQELIWETYAELRFAFTAQCFSQVTPEIAEALYQYVQTIVKSAKPKLVVDLYCGVGGFSLFAAKYAEQVIGIELSSWSIACAKKSAEKNDILNAVFIQADSNNLRSALGKRPIDLLICNPPRRGLSLEVIDQLKELRPKEIVYSSCNLETLVRDIELLKDYELKSLAPFEMFPLTRHLEVVAHLRSIAQKLCP